MITGMVIGLQAIVGVPFRLPGQLDDVIDCVADTGFEGAIALPPETINLLHLPFHQEIYANLADNSDIRVDAYRATIFWNEREISIAALALGRRPLLGTALLNGNELCAQFSSGGLVKIIES